MDPAEQQMAFVFSLRSRGVTNAEVLKAMEQTPRIDFLDGIFRDRSFEDVPLPIEENPQSTWKGFTERHLQGQ